jgi:hypothetical protein
MKKIGSVALAGAMACSLSIPAFAAAKNSTSVTATYAEIPIEVTVSDTGTATINPYGLPVKLTVDKTTKTVSGQKIVTTPLSIKNNGETDLSVNASVSVKNGTKSGIEFVKQSLTSANTGKQIYAYLEVAGTTVTSPVDDATTTLDEDILTAFTTDSTWATSQKVVLNADEAQKGEGLATLAAATVATTQDSEGKDVTTVTYNSGSIAVFRIGGEVVKAPADGAWATSDTFTTTIAFTFEPATDDSSDEETVVPGGDDEETVVPGGDDEDDNT